MSHPFTDIVCLVHNNLPITDGFARRMFQFTQNFRLIFVDNGSDEETASYLEKGSKDGKWTVVRSDTNLGVIGGRNLGAQHIESDYFMNIDNDQYVRGPWLEGLYNLMHRGYDIVGLEAWCLKKPNEKGQVVINGLAVQDQSYYPYKHCSKRSDKYSYIGCGGMLIKRQIYDDIGLFDERFSPAYFEDPDFCWRAIRAGYKLGWKYDSLIDHIGHQTIGFQKIFNKSAQFRKSWALFQEKWKPYYPEPMIMS